MNLKANTALQGYTATQSTTIGWKEINCTKVTTGSYQSSGMLRLAIAAGNPYFTFTTFQEEYVMKTNEGGNAAISFVMGWEVNTSGGIGNPTGYGACNFIPYQFGWNDGGTPWAYWNIGTRYIDWRLESSSYPIVTNNHRLWVYSNRIDLITLSCL